MPRHARAALTTTQRHLVHASAVAVAVAGLPMLASLTFPSSPPGAAAAGGPERAEVVASRTQSTRADYARARRTHERRLTAAVAKHPHCTTSARLADTVLVRGASARTPVHRDQVVAVSFQQAYAAARRGEVFVLRYCDGVVRSSSGV